MRLRRNLVCWASALALSLVFMRLGTAQDEALIPTETVEEIVVYGDATLNTLRNRVFLAQENFFDVFSALNDDDEYDIRCFYETPSGTRIKQHVCRANFVTAATSAEMSVWKSAGPQSPVVPARTIIAQKRKQLQEKIEMLVALRPELHEALFEYANAKQVFDTERKKRCDGRVFACQK